MVVPTYNVARYLPAFLQSLDDQVGGLADVELIFCDDGSTDNSGEIIEAWLSRNRGYDARLVTKPNGGLSSARNAGLEVASGKWVTFPDPDDVLTSGYLAVMRKFVRSDRVQTVHIVAGNLVYLEDETGVLSDTHPLRFKFAKHHRIVDLEQHPHFIHLAANTALYRRALLDKFGLRFDGRVKPNFEDAHMTGLYLAKFPRPRIAMVEDAVYLYRRRADGSSLVQGSWADEEKYEDLPRYGWLHLLRTVAAERGTVPRWIQNVVLYDMFWYFRMDTKADSLVRGLPAAWKDRFHANLEEVLKYIDAEAISEHRLVRLSDELRRAILYGAKYSEPQVSQVFFDRLDETRKLVRARYFYSGGPPEEQCFARGFVVRPVFGKIRAVSLLGRVMMYERTVWLPANGTLSLTLNGKPASIQLFPPSLPRYSVGPATIQSRLAEVDMPSGPSGPSGPSRPSRRAASGQRPNGSSRLDVAELRKAARNCLEEYGDLERAKQRISDASVRGLARSPYGIRRFKDAWLLIDRDNQAQDNAEHLYRYLQAEQPKVNSWFVLSRNCSDWDRLEGEGFRLLEHGSRDHVIALLNCENLISSQIDDYIVRPLDRARFGSGNWRYTFLQHGVIKDDLSRWLNAKSMDLMITTTPDEYSSIVSDGTPYTLSEKEVKLTGLPRHDRLLSLADGISVGETRSVLVMPTWRQVLLGRRLTGGNERGLRDDFWGTTYAVEWRKVLECERLHKVAAAYGWQIVFMPHPNMAGYLETSPLPPCVVTHKFQEIDVQKVLAEGGVMVTDYSSLAFEMAYIERPVVYFQFDQEEFFNGRHVYDRGSWSYEEQGFGPVTLDAETAVDEIIARIEAGGVPEPIYAERMKDAFPFRDGGCSRRTYEAICDLSRPLAYNQMYMRLEPAELLAGVLVEDAGEELNTSQPPGKANLSPISGA